MGHVYGVAGGSLTSDASFVANAHTAQQGKRAEEHIGALLADLAYKDGGPSLINDVMMPGKGVNADHVLVAGRKVFVIDAKCWLPGFYWTLGDVTRRETTRFPYADKKTMEMCREAMERHCSNMSKLTLCVAVMPSRKEGRLSLWAARFKGADLLRADQLVPYLKRRGALKEADPRIVSQILAWRQ